MLQCTCRQNTNQRTQDNDGTSWLNRTLILPNTFFVQHCCTSFVSHNYYGWEHFRSRTVLHTCTSSEHPGPLGRAPLYNKSGLLISSAIMYNYLNTVRASYYFWLPCSPISPHVRGCGRGAKMFFGFSALLSKQKLFRMSTWCQKDRKTCQQTVRLTDRQTDGQRDR